MITGRRGQADAGKFSFVPRTACLVRATLLSSKYGATVAYLVEGEPPAVYIPFFISLTASQCKITSDMARKGPWTDAQAEVAKSYFPEFRAFILKLKDEFKSWDRVKGKTAEATITAEKQRLVDKIIASSPLFDCSNGTLQTREKTMTAHEVREVRASI